MQQENNGKPLRPTEHAEDQLLTRILSGVYPPGTSLPAERDLAREIGVTRPTLRENLHSLASEGWITIRHGKPTQVNDYWKKGGLSLLSTISRYVDYLPGGFVTHLLELRRDLIPGIAVRAAMKEPGRVLEYLKGARDLTGDAETFTAFDWGLQRLMADASGNPIYPMILNDFSGIFKTLAVFYFAMAEGRASSLDYYKKLSRAVKSGKAERVRKAVRDVMEESLGLWESLSKKESA